VVIDSKGDIWISEPAANKIARLSGLTPSFALNAYPPFISISQGGSGTVSITGSSISRYAGTATISAVDLPNDVTYSVEPNRVSILAGENASSTLVLQATSNATLRTAAITFQASDGTIAHSVSILLTIANTTGPPAKPQCLIATATFGSQLSPQVELLRRYRDSVVSSRTGASFLLMFNAWYYSFSPDVAGYIGDHSNARWVMKGVLYPLIGSLTLSSELYSALSAYPEYATLLSGLLASSTIGAFYIGPPLSIIKRKLKLAAGTSLRTCGVSLLCGLCGISLGLNSGSTAMLMVAGPLTVLSTMFGSAALIDKILANLLQASHSRLADFHIRALSEFLKDLLA
jgi:peptide/nickel transport system substrate-binding protein